MMAVMRTLRIAGVIAVLFGVVEPAAAQAPSCSATGQSIFVRDTLQELYLW